MGYYSLGYNVYKPEDDSHIRLNPQSSLLRVWSNEHRWEVIRITLATYSKKRMSIWGAILSLHRWSAVADENALIQKAKVSLSGLRDFTHIQRALVPVQNGLVSYRWLSGYSRLDVPLRERCCGCRLLLHRVAVNTRTNVCLAMLRFPFIIPADLLA